MWVVVKDCVLPPDKCLVITLENDKSKQIFIQTDNNFGDLKDTADLIAKKLNKRDKLK